MTTAIKIENLSKKYIIGHKREDRYTALRDVMMHKLRSIGHRFMHPLSPNPEEVDVEEFWALKDINLEIQQGDRVGIIGRNGAGKSTLLKILSRITEPTKGRVQINGRVASLLEVGTGFHPELTGRENIYLNGAILGMSRTEINKKFDEIVDFSGVEKFLDTPVKRYSSGMYVRLAFSVAAHLESELLIVDEVLAVGDEEFQKKCLGKMGDVASHGRTLLFVSHNMSAIRNLCNKSVLLSRGKKVEYGGTEKVIKGYLSNFYSTYASSIEFDESFDDHEASPIRLVFKGRDGRETSSFGVGETWVIEFVFCTKNKIPSLVAAIGISTRDGLPVVNYFSVEKTVEKGIYKVNFVVNQTFSENDYVITIGLSSLQNSIFYKENVATINVSDINNSDSCYKRTRTKTILLAPSEAEIVSYDK